MSHKPIPVPDYRTFIWIKVKILCFLLLYALIGLLLFSFAAKSLAKFFALWDQGRWTILFGVYLIITGISTIAVSSWRVEVEMRQLQLDSVSGQLRDAIKNIRRLGHRVAGSVFVLLGLAFFASGVGRILGWWPPHEVFGSPAGRIALLVLLNLPMACGAAVMNMMMRGPGLDGPGPWE